MAKRIRILACSFTLGVGMLLLGATAAQAAEAIRAQEGLNQASRSQRFPSIALTSSYTRLGYPLSGFCAETIGFHATFALAAAMAGVAWIGAFVTVPSSRARASGDALALDAMLPFAGLRNFASTRRTTGTSSSTEPKCLSRNSPLEASASASCAAA